MMSTKLSTQYVAARSDQPADPLAGQPVRAFRCARRKTMLARPPGAMGSLRELTQRALGGAARGLIAARVTANMVTTGSLALGGLAGVLVANGFFALAATTFALASLGDALDGAVARSSGNESSGGGLFDACADRYGEFFFLAGLAFRSRAHQAALALVLFALLGAFMVSYGSAKAEALGVPVPTGTMRRAQRAACLSLGAVLVPISTLVASRFDLPEWMNDASVLVALAILAILGNASAIVRLRGIALATRFPDVRP
jgi:CDP-diacylglycerol--glycerol-3-phosphate 3-phosphatidyltransferase